MEKKKRRNKDILKYMLLLNQHRKVTTKRLTTFEIAFPQHTFEKDAFFSCLEFKLNYTTRNRNHQSSSSGPFYKLLSCRASGEYPNKRHP